MEPLDIDDVKKYVEDNIGTFHSKRLQKIVNLNLSEVLTRKNPYLFKAKNILTAQDLIQTLLDATISSGEETIFGDWLEGLAVFINSKVYGGWKAGIKGIDLEFNKNGNRYIVNIKSGPNWGNSSQITKMLDDFKTAKKTLRTSNSNMNIISVNGCCYGRDNNPDKGDYYKYCGQRFWEFISDNKSLYIDIIEPLGHKSKEKNEEFNKEYSVLINKFTFLFMYHFCDDGKIDWDSLVKYNSSAEETKKKLTEPP
jgi:hypothetical protein